MHLLHLPPPDHDPPLPLHPQTMTHHHSSLLSAHLLDSEQVTGPWLRPPATRHLLFDTEHRALQVAGGGGGGGGQRM